MPVAGHGDFTSGERPQFGHLAGLKSLLPELAGMVRGFPVALLLVVVACLRCCYIDFRAMAFTLPDVDIVLPVAVAASSERQIRTALSSVRVGSARSLWRVFSSLTPITMRSRNVSLEIATRRSLHGEQDAACRAPAT